MDDIAGCAMLKHVTDSQFWARMSIFGPCEAPILPASRPAARSFRRPPLGSTKSNTTAYMRPRVSRVFFAISISSLPTFQDGSRERSSALMARQALCLADVSRSTPGARRVAPEGARGWRRNVAPSYDPSRPLRRCKCTFSA